MDENKFLKVLMFSMMFLIFFLFAYVGVSTVARMTAPAPVVKYANVADSVSYGYVEMSTDELGAWLTATAEGLKANENNVSTTVKVTSGENCYLAVAEGTAVREDGITPIYPAVGNTYMITVKKTLVNGIETTTAYFAKISGSASETAPTTLCGGIPPITKMFFGNRALISYTDRTAEGIIFQSCTAGTCAEITSPRIIYLGDFKAWVSSTSIDTSTPPDFLPDITIVGTGDLFTGGGDDRMQFFKCGVSGCIPLKEYVDAYFNIEDGSLRIDSTAIYDSSNKSNAIFAFTDCDDKDDYIRTTVCNNAGCSDPGIIIGEPEDYDLGDSKLAISIIGIGTKGDSIPRTAILAFSNNKYGTADEPDSMMFYACAVDGTCKEIPGSTKTIDIKQGGTIIDSSVIYDELGNPMAFFVWTDDTSEPEKLWATACNATECTSTDFATFKDDNMEFKAMVSVTTIDSDAIADFLPDTAIIAFADTEGENVDHIRFYNCTTSSTIPRIACSTNTPYLHSNDNVDIKRAVIKIDSVRIYNTEGKERAIFAYTDSAGDQTDKIWTTVCDATSCTDKNITYTDITEFKAPISITSIIASGSLPNSAIVTYGDLEYDETDNIISYACTVTGTTPTCTIIITSKNAVDIQEGSTIIDSAPVNYP